MSEWQRCKGCGKTWPKYNPNSVLGVLRLVLRVPSFYWHYRVACPQRRSSR